MTDLDNALQRVVVPFADELDGLLKGVFGRDVTVEIKELGDWLVVKLHPLHLTVTGEELASLTAEFRCTWDSAGTYLAVEKSTIKLTALVDRAPIFRFEYERAAYNKPCGHIQVHAHRGALSHLLSKARHQTPHSLEALHLPVGGSRFRPCLEDVLQFLVQDCGFDAEPGWLDHVERGRERWRRKQLRAMVRAVPDEAAQVLRAIGYTVEEPVGGPPSRGSVTLRAW